MKIIGHRGASGNYPENTLIAFDAAYEWGAHGIEFDVHRCQDDHLVVIHDSDVSRTTDGYGRVKDLSLVKLQQLDAGSYRGEAFSQERIPTLEEVLSRYTGRIAFDLYLELKSGSLHYPGIEEQLIATYLALDETQRASVQISSFDHQALFQIKKACPQVRVGLSLDCNVLDPIQMAKAIGAESLNIQWEWVSPTLIDQAHAAELQVIVWTVNTPDVVQILEEMNVDGIITDYPERWVE